ncbi:DUF7338 family protein [Cupriavidus yeoncheonensis]|uniref:DUF7338 family protein n=1 Tax=Cupriavidus yeoncheonensis TaxID=1462994 RepID=UPI003B84A1F9
MFLAYAFLALLSLTFAAMTMLLAPVLSLTANSTANLPHWLSWFQTFDADLNQGWRQGSFDAPRNALELWRCARAGYGGTLATPLIGCTFRPDQRRVLAYRSDGSLFRAEDLTRSGRSAPGSSSAGKPPTTGLATISAMRRGGRQCGPRSAAPYLGEDAADISTPSFLSLFSQPRTFTLKGSSMR